MSSNAAYDLVVIGGGSGGSACARRAAGYGASVCLIERGPTRGPDGQRTGAGNGGTCVNVGCVPKKLMFNAAQHRENLIGAVSITDAYGLSVDANAGQFDWAALKKRRDAYVAKLNANYNKNWNKEGIEVLTGVARFETAKTVAVDLGDGTTTTLQAKHVLIACGGIPVVPDIPGKELCITSDGFFDLEEQPSRVAVVGAGYIAVEMAGILHGLGSETELFVRGKTPLRRGFDPYIVETLMEEINAHGPVVHTHRETAALTRDAEGTISLKCNTGEEHSGYDVVLMAIGRKPVTDTLCLDLAGVTTTASGHIVVDEYENTNVPGVMAIGDATTTGHELTPVAIAAGRRLADRLFGGEPKARLEYSDIATVVFSHPPIGTVGLTEQQARDQFGDNNITTKQSRFPSMLYAFNKPEGKVKTAIKLVLLGEEEKVVGLHIIGPFSDEILQGFAVAVKMGATRADLEASVAIHPTIGEELVTFGGWGQDKQRRPKLPPNLLPKTASQESMRWQFMLGMVAGGAGVTGVAWLMGRL